MKTLGQFTFAALLLVLGALPAAAQQSPATTSGKSIQGMSDKSMQGHVGQDMNPFQKDAMSAWIPTPKWRG